MKPEQMEAAMMENMPAKTGKTINKWIDLVHNQKFNTKSEVVSFLKTQYSIGHFYAHLIAKKSL